MKIQLDHEEIKINVELEGIETAQAQGLAKKIFNVFLESIHIVNSESKNIIENNGIEKNSAESDRKENEPAAAAQVKPDPLDPEDNQQAVADALAAYEKAQAEKIAKANMFGLGRLAQLHKTPLAGLDGIPSSAYRNQFGKTLFQTFIICADCHSKEKHFVERGTPFVNCKSCGKRNVIRPAALGNFPHIDNFNNIYIGGTFKRADEREVNFQAVDA